MHKIIKTLFPFFLIIIFILLGNYIYIYTHANKLFKNYKIQISGNQYLNNTQITETLNYNKNSSLFNIDIIKIKTKLEKMDFIKSVQISQILPNSILIQIIEREPLVLVNNKNKTIFLDSHGISLPVDNNSLVNFPVPLLIIKDEKYDFTYQTNKITEIINHIFFNYPNFYKSINEIIIDSNIWEFRDNQKTKFYVNKNHLIEQLIILKKFEDTIYPIKEFKDYNYIDLTTKNKIIVKEKYRKG